MVEHTKRYAARTDWDGSVEVGDADFVKCPKSWRAVTRTGLVFDCKVHFKGVDPPGHASPREAVEAWIEKQEKRIATYLERITGITARIAQARENRAELLSAREGEEVQP